MRSLTVCLAALCALTLSCAKKPEPPKSVCADVTCDHGHCVTDGDHAACLCDAPFFSTGLSCTVGAAEACTDSTCAGTNKTCISGVNGLSCICPDGTVETNGNCFAAAACTPNPCSAPHKSGCTLYDGHALCVCDPGYEPAVNGCLPQPPFDCTHTHGGDGFEPDECPSKASVLPLDTPVTHTLSPAGDDDWIALPSAQGHIIKVSVSDTVFPVYIDIFGADGLIPVAANHNGTRDPSIGFVDETGGAHYARIRALRANDSDSYVVKVTDLGNDDYTNDPASALTIAPGNSFTGEVQYAGDVDVVMVPVQPLHSYSLQPESGAVSANVELEVRGADGGVLGVVQGATGLTPHSTSSGALTVAARGSFSGATGMFDLPIVDLGSDDRSNEVFDSDFVSPTTYDLSGVFERAGDVDVVRFHATARHVYLFTCKQTGSVAGCAATIRDSSGVVLAALNPNAYYPPAAAKAQANDVWSIAMVTATYAPVTGTYSFRIQDLGADDYTDDDSTATPIALGQAKTGQVELSNDVDAFSFTASAGHAYLARCGTTTSNCLITIEDASGSTLASGTYNGAVSFLAASSGVYYLHVASSGGTFSYSVSVTDQGLDDHGNSVTSATTVVPGSAAAGGRTEYAGDEDYFVFTATQGHIYHFVCTSTQQGLCSLVARDPVGAEVASADWYNSSPRTVTFLARTSGGYTIEVSGSTATPGVFGTYSYQLFDEGLDDHGDTASSATPLTVGGNEKLGSLQYPGDVDTFSFAATAPNLYAITCASASSEVCRLTVSASGTTLAYLFPDGTSGSSTLTVKAKASGAYAVQLGAISGAQGVMGGYTLAVADAGYDDFGDTAATATPITPNAAAGSGKFDSYGDEDFFSFTSSAGHIYRFTCSASGSLQCMPQLKDSTGATIANGYGPSAPIEFVATTAATYYVDVMPGSATSHTGPYSYQLLDVGPDDFGNNQATASAITPGTTVAGNIQYSADADAFSFTPTLAHFYSASCTSLSSSCELVVLDSNGTERARSYTEGTVWFTAGLAGSWLLTNGPVFNRDGAYNLLLSDLGLDDFGDTFSTATAISLGAQTAGRIQIPNEPDVFAVSLTAGSSYTVTTGAASAVQIAVFQSNQATISLGYSEPITFTAPVSGTYYVRLTSAGGTPSYLLTVQ